jgi:mRNA-degrading endonuclease YafQ of YafQ-DinJ toxin-antitoxin module
MLDFYFQAQFKKDLKLIQKRRYDMDAIYDVIATIIWGELLPERCREHGIYGVPCPERSTPDVYTR